MICSDVGSTNSFSNSTFMAYSILTPYYIPKELRATKRINMGDGFILKSIQALLEPHECKYILTSRKPLGDRDLEKINSTKALILAGANQLDDHFSMVPGMSAKALEKIKIPIVPFGVGINGNPKANTQMSSETMKVLLEIHNRIKYSSWRCPLTINYISQSLPQLSTAALMTGCPVMYGKEILNGARFSSSQNKIAVTITDRGDFWEREKQTIDFVADQFPDSIKVLSLHQPFGRRPDNFFGFLPIYRGNDERNNKQASLQLQNYAKQNGYRIFAPKTAKECLNFYEGCDIHIGSRLHAHLHFLSKAKKSFLSYVDERCTGFSKALNFPVCEYTDISKYINYDFEIYRNNCQLHYQTMLKFVSCLKSEVL